MAGLTQSSTLSGQFRNFFSKELLSYAVQELKLDQFARKAGIPKKAGAKGITMFRYGAPSAGDVQALTEGTTPTQPTTSHQLALSSISKSLAQYGHTVTLTDIMKATELFNSVSQAVKVTGQNFSLWYDTVIRNVAVGSNLTASNGSFGSAKEGGGTLDNSDTLVETYGDIASCTQTYTGLNSETTNCKANAASILDLMTKLRSNRAPELDGGGYAFVTDPRVARDLMRDTDWLDVSKYSAAKQLFKGEVGSLYGVRVVTQTNSFISTGSATAGDAYIYNPASGGTASGSDIIASFALGAEAWGVPELNGDSAAAPSIDILDKADKSDPHNQRIIVAGKAYFAALRLNPNYYIVHRTKTGHTL